MKTIVLTEDHPTWTAFAGRLDRAKPQKLFVVHGYSRSISGNEVWIDCGDELGDVSMVKMTFRDRDAAWAAYCKGMRLTVKVAEVES